jgi:RHS repeat-associated protein
VLNSQSSLLQSFAWGLDLSDSMQGAGGVGGLLMVRDQTAINNQPSTHFPAYDGNGNVAALMAAASGTVSATYEYGPFSEGVRLTGPMAHANKFRFSTKYQDDESDYLYYGYRSYNPSAGRWPNRDPLNELGHRTLLAKRSSRVQSDAGNLYEFVGNNPVSQIDPLGLIKFEGCEGREEDLKQQFNNFCQKVKDPAFANCLGCSLSARTIVNRLKNRCDNPDDSLHGIKIKCEQNDSGMCNGACAWSIPGGDTIHICPQQWSNPGCGQSGCTLMHELTHMSGRPSEKWPENVEKCLGCK